MSERAVTCVRSRVCVNVFIGVSASPRYVCANSRSCYEYCCLHVSVVGCQSMAFGSEDLTLTKTAFFNAVAAAVRQHNDAESGKRRY